MKVEYTVVVHAPEATGGFSGYSRIYHRIIETTAVPLVDEQVQITDLNPEEDGEGEMFSATVKRRWFSSADDCVTVELIDYQVNPIPLAQSLCDGRYRIPWYSPPDSDLVELLTRAGFEVY